MIIKGSSENDINNALFDASQQHWQLAIVILNGSNSDTMYSFVKKYANRRIGLMTQCINYQTLKRNINNLNMCKYILKITEI